MFDILVHIIAFASWVFFFMAIFSFVVLAIRFIGYLFSSKPSKGAPSSMPWWVWWTSFRD